MKNHVNMPQLRFPEFTDEWEQFEFGTLFSERNERGKEGLPILTVSIHDGVSDGELDAENLGKQVRRSEDKSSYKRVYPGDLVLNMMRAWQGAIGVVMSEGMVSPAYITATPSEDVFPPFLDYVARRKPTIEQINQLSYGVTDFRKRLYWDSFVRVKCKLPKRTEQEKIWKFLNCVDSFIETYENKINRIKTLKKGLLQKMFPKEGMDVPEIRFPGFSDAWEQRKLGDVIKIMGGNAWKSSDYSDDGEYLVVTIANVTGDVVVDDSVGKHISCADPNGYLLQEHDILVSLTGNVGRVSKMSKTKGVLNQRVGKVALINKDVSAGFLFHLLRNPRFEMAMNDAGQGAAQKNISNGDVYKYSVGIPASKMEQSRIAVCLDNLDNLITLHQRKFEKLNTYKNGLLQQMFV